jgi:hypothetical protein
MEATSMWKYLIALVALFAAVGFAAACYCTPDGDCIDCYSNIITQDSEQGIYGIFNAAELVPKTSNEGSQAAIMLTRANDEVDTGTDGVLIIDTSFGKIEQTLTQTVACDANVLGAFNSANNKASQAAWMENQGKKEKDSMWNTIEHEGGLIHQNIDQAIAGTVDLGVVFGDASNCDSQLAVMADNLNTLTKTITLTASSTVTTTAVSSLDCDGAGCP